ncbi:MAG: alpha/beta fold hydrolase [Solirubrobacterales bacterium]|jgi:pimeloyl-ACP methyl ester carboxylesterase|nr:alpha/beta fold hydrolase [Solirubrobacterales bacterium]
MPEFTVDTGASELAGEEAGEGMPVILLHGLTATRRYVVMGSRSLERSGHRVVSYDARGHGASTPAPDAAAYGYEALSADLLALMDARGVERGVLAGASMGAHTILAFVLAHPERVAGMCLITPAFDPDERDPSRFARWDALSDGLRTSGVDGFVDAYGVPAVPERWRETVQKILRQRLSAHAHPDAVADALQAVPRARPFDTWEALTAIDKPSVVVADRDDADPEHPLATGERYAQALGDVRLVVEEPGSSPLAWQGGQLSKIIASITSQSA